MIKHRKILYNTIKGGLESLETFLIQKKLLASTQISFTIHDRHFKIELKKKNEYFGTSMSYDLTN